MNRVFMDRVFMNRVFIDRVHKKRIRFLCTFLVNKRGGAYDKYYRAEGMDVPEAWSSVRQGPSGIGICHETGKRISRNIIITWR
ncbi:hypothetical protein CBFG_02693 [Clostridiales bacterium 1_7_47FAA]|nr:hypothetical protein CBFG_02693 [Clostridiales bacterium 1_7_47FAA]